MSPVRPEKLLLSRLIDPASTLPWGEVSDCETKQLILLYALRSAGIEASGVCLKIPMRPKERQVLHANYQASSDVRAIVFSGSKVRHSIHHGVSLAAQKGMWFKWRLPQQLSSFEPGKPFWEVVWPVHQPLSELEEEILSDFRSMLPKAVSIANAWMLDQQTKSAVPVPPSGRSLRL